MQLESHAIRPATLWSRGCGLRARAAPANPDYGSFGPRLSSHAELKVLSPDFLHEQGVLLGILLVGWRARQSHAGLVSYPLATGRGIYTTRENAADLAGLNGFLDAAAPPGAPILDVTNERALYYLLQRRPPTRCSDVAMLSAPPLLAEAMRQLEANPPACVIVEGMKELDQYDGVPNRIRVPALFAWIDARYPHRARVGRYLVATR